jgi:hypothetical protein
LGVQWSDERKSFKIKTGAVIIPLMKISPDENDLIMTPTVIPDDEEPVW